MSTVISVASAIFWGVLILSVLVFVHEGGHYLASRAFHVRATEFFLGLPSRWKISRKSKKVGTEFGVTPFLLGGYTQICGMEPVSDELLAPALQLVMRRGRIPVTDVASELGIDVDHAYGLLVSLCDWAAIRPYYDPKLGETPSQKNYPSSFETLERDPNHLTEYDRGHDFSLPGTTAAGEPHETGMSADEFLAHERSRTYLGASFPKRVVMLAAGPLVNIVLAFLIVTFAFMVRGVDYIPNVNTLGGVEEGSIAQESGLEGGDTIVTIGDTDVDTWDDIVLALQPLLESGEDFQIVYERDGATFTTTVDLPDGEKVEALGISSQPRQTYHPGFLEAAQATLDYTGQVASYVAQLLVPTRTMEILDQSSSIVGISAMAAEAASTGLYNLMMFAAAISMSLGFMNLLPIPPFDGGKILIEIIQLIIRRPLSMRAQSALSYLGVGFMIFVFVVVLKNDIFRFLIG